jgi:hypothetical protein
MTQWELAACVDGYNRAHAGDDTPPDPMSSEEFDAMRERHAAVIPTLH